VNGYVLIIGQKFPLRPQYTVVLEVSAKIGNIAQSSNYCSSLELKEWKSKILAYYDE